MSDEKKISMMNDFVKSLEEQDREKMMSIITDDFCWHTPHGSFCGREEMNRYLDWFHQTTTNLKFKDVGLKKIIQGDRAIYEHEISGEMLGEKVSFLTMCSYKFNGEKIQEVSSVYDRLTLAEQASSSWLPKKMVNTVVNQMQKGL